MKQKALTATLWSGADFLIRQGLQFIVSIILARILSPEEFGTIALLFLFTGIASALVDSGFSAALIQKKETTQLDESTVFWFTFIMSVLMALVLCLVAPAIANFYSMPVLVPLTMLMALNIVITALGVVHATLLTKQLDFKTQLKIGAYASVLSGLLAVAMALKGCGIWALAGQIILASVITTILLWIYRPWRPSFSFSKNSAVTQFSYGGYLLAATLIDIIYTRGYSLLIGKFYGVRELGFYSRAEGIKQLPVSGLSSVMSRVAFPLFSAAAADKVLLKRGVQFSLRGMMLINIPMMIGLAAVAEPLVLVLIGKQWLPAVPVLQVLCIGGIFWPLHVINLNALIAQGHSKMFFSLEFFKKSFGIGFLLLGTYYGVLGIAWSQVAYGAFAFFINAHYTKKYLNYGAMAQIRDFLPILLISIPMGIIVFWLNGLLSSGPLLKLIMLVLIGVIFFCMAAWGCRLKALHDAMGLLKRAPTTTDKDSSLVSP
jgi:teichuronic acid exporter